jgi:hypothetical protein
VGEVIRGGLRRCVTDDGGSGSGTARCGRLQPSDAAVRAEALSEAGANAVGAVCGMGIRCGRRYSAEYVINVRNLCIILI